MRLVATLAGVLCVMCLASAAELCPAGLSQLQAQARLDSATVLRYTPGVYAIALGESRASLTEAKNNAKLELVKLLNSQITSVLHVIEKNGAAQWAQTETKVESSFDQMPLLRSDPDLVCQGAQGFIAEAHLKLEDYLMPLKMAYEDSAKPFRASLEQALAAKDKERFNAAYTRAARLQKAVVSRGKYLMAVLAEASRGQSMDIAAVLQKNPLPEFERDMAMWDKVSASKEAKVGAIQVGIVNNSSASHFTPPLTDALANMGVAVASGKIVDYQLILDEKESGYEGNFGGVFTCEVEAKVELRNAKGKVLGSKPLRSKDWKLASVGDSSEVCGEAWAKVDPGTVEQLLKPLLGAYVPIR